jgi:hypothetical protein
LLQERQIPCLKESQVSRVGAAVAIRTKIIDRISAATQDDDRFRDCFRIRALAFPEECESGIRESVKGHFQRLDIKQKRVDGTLSLETPTIGAREKSIHSQRDITPTINDA